MTNVITKRCRSIRSVDQLAKKMAPIFNHETTSGNNERKDFICFGGSI
jgi:hypothetical protein